MKIKNIEINIGNIVLINERYNNRLHYLKTDRRHVGIVNGLNMHNGTKSITITYKDLINFKDVNINNWRELLSSKLFRNIGFINFGVYSTTIFDEINIKDIKILKK